MGAVGGLFLIFLGIICCLVAVVAMAHFFWTKANDHEEQPEGKYRLLVNLGLATILPTLALFIVPMFMFTTNYMYWDEMVFSLSLLLVFLSFAVSRGDCKATWKVVPGIAALLFLNVTGLTVIEMGRIYRGKGYNEEPRRVQITGWEALEYTDDDSNAVSSSLITMEFEGSNGKTCEVSLPYDCSFDGSRYSYSDDRNNWETTVQTYFYYSDYSDREFTCADGFADDVEEEQQDDANAQDDAVGDDAYWSNYDMTPAEYPVASELLVNTYTCKAAWYTYDAYNKEFIWETPTEALTFFSITTVVCAIVYGAWQMCSKRKDTSDRNKDLLTNEVATSPVNETSVPADTGVIA